MATVEEKIHLAFKNRVSKFALPSYLPTGYVEPGYEEGDWGIPVAFPGEPFYPRNAYIRFGEVYSDPLRITVDDGRPYLRTGFLMLTFVGKVIIGIRSEDYTRMAGRIAQHFQDNVKIRHEGVCVSIYNAPTFLTAYETDGYWNVPIRIPWRCFA